MDRSRSRPGDWRGAWALLFVLLIAVRLASPVGFMPGTSGDRPAIVICDDFRLPGASHHGHDQSGEKIKHSCPYASATPLGTDFAVASLPEPVVAFDALPPSGVRQFLIERFRRDERPPSQGPPAIA
jgi:hypothetical protein